MAIPMTPTTDVSTDKPPRAMGRIPLSLQIFLAIITGNQKQKAGSQFR
jgi:hypothetical protein